MLAYAHDPSEGQKRSVALSVLRDLWRDRTGRISTQVLQEFYVVATQKFDPPMPSREARDIIVLYAAWPVVEVDVPMILAATDLAEHHSFSFWDALIVEAAARSGATRLVTEDLQSGRRFAGIRIENPFR